MSISPNYAFAPNADALLRQAFQRAGLLPLGRPLPSAQASDALEIMTTILKASQAAYLRLTQEERTTLALAAGTASYVLPADTIAVLEPVKLILTDGKSEVSVRYASWTEYQTVPNHTLQGVPLRVFFERTSVFTALVDPIPDKAYTLTFRRERLIRNAESGSGVDLNQHWFNWLVLATASAIASASSLSTSTITRLAAEAKEAEKQARLIEADRGDMQLTVGGLGWRR